MDSKFNIFGEYEVPEIYLCNPDRSQLCVITGKNRSVTLRLNGLSDLSLEVDKIATNNEGNLNKGYDLLESKRLLYVTNIGWFEIQGVTETDNASGCYKTITAESHQGALRNKGFSCEERIYTFYNSNDPLDDEYDASDVASVPSVIGQLNKQLGIQLDLHYQDIEAEQDYDKWTITYIDDAIRFPNDADGVYRTLENTLTNGYDFMYNIVEEAYEIIWIFDILHHVIKVKTVESITTPTNIYLSFDNLIEQIEVSEDAENIVTVLNCKGNNLDIQTVNPMGTGYIVNFDYYKDASGKWMSKSLIDALDEWEDICSSYENQYTELVAQLRELYEQQTTLDNEMTSRQLTIDTLCDARDLYIANYPLLAEVVMDGERSSDTYSQFNSVDFNSAMVGVCYRKPPEVENANYTFTTANHESDFANNYDLGYLYFQDNDTLTYCKLIKNDNGELGFERYGQYEHIIQWCECSENIGTITSVETIGLGENSLCNDSNFNINSFTKHNTETFRCYINPPTLTNNELEWGDDFIVDTLDNCFNNQYYYFADGDNTTYCKILGAAEVDTESNQAIYYASGFTRFTLIKNVPNWITLHENRHLSVKNEYDLLDTTIEEVFADMSAIANECNVLKYIKQKDSTGKLYNELECYWIEGEYTNNNLAVLDETTLEETIDLAKQLKSDGERQLARKSQPTFSFTINAIDFTKLKIFEQFASQFELGKTIIVEKSENVIYSPASTEVSFDLDSMGSFSLVFSNSARLNENDFTFADLVAENSQVSKNVSSNWQNLTEYSRNKEAISNLIANPLDRALRAGNSNMVNQEFIIDSTGILGRKYVDDSHSSFVPEQMRIMNNSILFTDDNWNSVKTALGRIYYDYEGQERSAYGLVAQTIVGSLLIGEHLKITNGETDSTVDLGADGITIRKLSDGVAVFHADTSGTVNVIGDIRATSGYIGSETSGFTISSDSISHNLDDVQTRVLISTGSTESYEVNDSGEINGWMLLAGENFGVTNQGWMYVNAGKIGDVNIMNETTSVSGYDVSVNASPIDASRVVISPSIFIEKSNSESMRFDYDGLNWYISYRVLSENLPFMYTGEPVYGNGVQAVITSANGVINNVYVETKSTLSPQMLNFNFVGGGDAGNSYEGLDWCSERNTHEIMDTGVSVKCCDCNPLATMLISNGSTSNLFDVRDDINIEDSTLLLFDEISKSFKSFISKFTLSEELQELNLTSSDDSYSSYETLVDKIKNLFNTANDKLSNGISYITNESVILGLNAQISIGFNGEDNASQEELKTVVSRLFGYSSVETFVEYAQTLAEYYNANAGYASTSSVLGRIIYDGAVYTDGGLLILPYVFTSEGYEPLASCIIVDSNGNMYAWLNSIENAFKITDTNNEIYNAIIPDNSTDNTIEITTYGRCVLFEVPPAVTYWYSYNSEQINPDIQMGINYGFTPDSQGDESYYIYYLNNGEWGVKRIVDLADYGITINPYVPKPGEPVYEEDILARDPGASEDDVILASVAHIDVIATPILKRSAAGLYGDDFKLITSTPDVEDEEDVNNATGLYFWNEIDSETDEPIYTTVMDTIGITTVSANFVTVGIDDSITANTAQVKSLYIDSVKLSMGNSSSGGVSYTATMSKSKRSVTITIKNQYGQITPLINGRNFSISLQTDTWAHNWYNYTVWIGEGQSSGSKSVDWTFGINKCKFIDSGTTSLSFTQNLNASGYDLMVAGNLTPDNPNVRYLGFPGRYWKSLYVEDVYENASTIVTSDRNKKSDIVDISKKYSELFDLLRPVSFQYTDGSSDRTHMGLIAQELKESIEEVGLTTQDVAAYCEWKTSETDISCGIRYSELIPLNILEIQKLKARVAELEKEVQQLKK